MRGFALSGELVSTADIPFAPGFNLEVLKTKDPEPVFANVRIKAGRGDQGSGPYYGPEILKSLERQINEKIPPGYRGHQDVNNVSWEWREPVTAWVGAKFVPEGEGALYVKGYVPRTAESLRSQLDLAESGADVVNSVSIFGLRAVDDEDQVTNFDLWSLDWTPKGRAGMEAELVGVTGEQSNEEQEILMDRDEVIRSLTVEEVPDHIAATISDQARAESAPLQEAVGEIRVILELDENVDAEAVVSAVRQIVDSNKQVELEEKVAEMVSDTVSGEMAIAAVRDTVLPRVKVSSTDEEIKAEIKSVMDLPYIAALGDGSIIPVVQGGIEQGKQRQGTAWA